MSFLLVAICFGLPCTVGPCIPTQSPDEYEEIWHQTGSVTSTDSGVKCVNHVQSSSALFVQRFSALSTLPTSTESTTSSTSTSSTTSTTTTTTTSTTSTTTTTTTTTSEKCLQDWIYYDESNKCYYIGTAPGRLLHEGASLCAAQQALLASIHSEAENNFIIGLVPVEPKYILFGLQRSGTNFLYYDGTDFDYANWDTNEPNSLSQPYCITFAGDYQFATEPHLTLKGKWHDMPGNWAIDYYVCQLPSL